MSATLSSSQRQGCENATLSRIQNITQNCFSVVSDISDMLHMVIVITFSNRNYQELEMIQDNSN